MSGRHTMHRLRPTKDPVDEGSENDQILCLLDFLLMLAIFAIAFLIGQTD